jgi:hypothetical protein
MVKSGICPKSSGVAMKKLMLSVLAMGCLFGAANVALADEDSQAGSAWVNSPYLHPTPPPGAPDYYGNNVWPPAPQVQPQPRARAPLSYGNRGAVVPQQYPADRVPQYSSAPHYPYTTAVPVAPVVPVGPRTERDRDGDGVPNRRDAYPDDPTRR